MTTLPEDELRALVREVIRRHLQAPAAALLPADPLSHPSHARFARLVRAEPDGPCLVEPHLPCIHCAYCQSHGH